MGWGSRCEGDEGLNAQGKGHANLASSNFVLGGSEGSRNLCFEESLNTEQGNEKPWPGSQEPGVLAPSCP